MNKFFEIQEEIENIETDLQQWNEEHNACLESLKIRIALVKLKILYNNELKNKSK